MDIKIQAWLLDIIVSIDEIFEFLGDVNDFSAYKNDLKTKKAIERNLEIIGEAMNRILKVDPHFPLDNAHNIIGTRNRIQSSKLQNFTYKKAPVGISSQEIAFKEQNDGIVYDILGQ